MKTPREQAAHCDITASGVNVEAHATVYIELEWCWAYVRTRSKNFKECFVTDNDLCSQNVLLALKALLCVGSTSL